MTNLELVCKWCGTPGSNRRPSDWQPDALPTELVPLLDANIPFKYFGFKLLGGYIKGN